MAASRAYATAASAAVAYEPVDMSRTCRGRVADVTSAAVAWVPRWRMPDWEMPMEERGRCGGDTGEIWGDVPRLGDAYGAGGDTKVNDG